MPSTSHHLPKMIEHTHPDLETKLDRTRLVAVLQELHRLLEEYAPSWYTERLHDQSEALLRDSKES